MEGTEGKVRIVVDKKELLVRPGVMILEAARENNIYIPTLCHHPTLTPWGGCRLCMVEVDGAPKLAASCITPVRNGMEIVTWSERIVEARKAVLEFLFSERNHNCMFCPQSGACELQRLAYEMQMDHLTVSSSYDPFPTDVTSEYMVMDHNRCVLCGRCVRACAELAGNYVLNFQHRGPRSLVGMDLDDRRENSTCLSCGLCMQLCPTGAITSRYRSHYAVKGHEGEKRIMESVCTRCGLLCPIVVTASGDNLLKVEGRLSPGNGRPDKGQLCYKGRFEVFKEEKRLTLPMVRGKDGTWKEEGWGNALRIAAERLKAIKEKYGRGSLVGFASSNLSNEELILFKDVLEGSLGTGTVDTLDGNHYRSILKTLDPAGPGLREAPWQHIARADFILIIGGDPYESQPMLTSLIRKGTLEGGLKVAMVGKVNGGATRTTMGISVKPGNEVRFLEAFLASVETDGSGKKVGQFDPAVLVNEICAAGEDRERFAETVRAFLDAEDPLVIVGPSITQSAEGVRLAAEISMVKGFLAERTLRLVFLKPSGNSAGSWKLGIPSKSGRETCARWKGGLVLLGGFMEPNPLPELPEELEFLVVVTPYYGDEVARKAQLLIPRPSWAETEGGFTSLDGQETGYAVRILDPPEGVQDSLKTLIDLKTLMEQGAK